MDKGLLKNLPSVDSILKDAAIAGLLRCNPRRLVLEAIRCMLGKEREYIRKGSSSEYRFDMDSFRERVNAEVERIGRPSLMRVVNATGVVLHTNLGRAPLAAAAVKSLADASGGYSNLEFDLEKGERGERHSHLEPLICRLTGAEAALAVNNNAAAVLLSLNTVAEGKEVIVSRGELVEIGGSFRIPDVMEKSGARLVEVGTTNRTHIRDYEAAITPETALILKVHRSNFGIVGFTSDVRIAELAELGKRHGIPVMNDLGSGSLIDLFPETREPTVRDALSGSDIATFSGDKLLGGPQAGIIIGRRDILSRVKKNPLTRALRIDKLTVAALEATLRIYMDENRAVREIPILNMLTMPVPELTRRGRRLLKSLRDISDKRFEVNLREGSSQVGGGALPLQEIETRLVTVRPIYLSPNRLEEAMRMNSIPIIVRIERDEVVIDMRTLMEGDAGIIVEFFRSWMKGG